MTVDAVERGLLDGQQVLRVLAEVVVGALLHELVIAVDRRREGVGVDAELAGELLDAVGHVGVHEALVHALLLAVVLGLVVLETVGVNELALPVGRARHVVGVEDLRVPAAVLGAPQQAVHEGHGRRLVAEAVAVVLDGEEGHVAHGGGAGVEVVQHLRVVQVLDLAARPHDHLVAVTGLVELLALEVLEVGQVVGAHVHVVLVVARGHDDALAGVELDVVAVLVLADDTADAAAVLHELLGGRLVVDVHALLLGHAGQGDHAVAGVVGLRAEERRDVVHLVAVDLDDGALLLVALVNDLRAALGGLLDDPLHGLAGVPGPVLEHLAVRAVGVLLHLERDEGLHAGGVGVLQVDARAGVALGDGRGLLLHERDLGARLAGGEGGGHAGGAGADDDDVIVLRVGDLARVDGVGRLEERGRGDLGFKRRALGRLGGLREARGGDACGGQPASLEKVPARDAFHGWSSFTLELWSSRRASCQRRAATRPNARIPSGSEAITVPITRRFPRITRRLGLVRPRVA